MISATAICRMAMRPMVRRKLRPKLLGYSMLVLALSAPTASAGTFGLPAAGSNALANVVGFSISPSEVESESTKTNRYGIDRVLASAPGAFSDARAIKASFASPLMLNMGEGIGNLQSNTKLWGRQ